jgi:hypothetical protein
MNNIFELSELALKTKAASDRIIFRRIAIEKDIKDSFSCIFLFYFFLNKAFFLFFLLICVVIILNYYYKIFLEESEEDYKFVMKQIDVLSYSYNSLRAFEKTEGIDLIPILEEIEYYHPYLEEKFYK